MFSLNGITSFVSVMVRRCVDSGLVGLLWLIVVLRAVVNYEVNHSDVLNYNEILAPSLYVTLC